ncbi:MAG: dihydrodipicolinate synthase family protein [Synergistaceae bacterium]|nr:dihydrodipicolinate synthase family protein [Synergistaceae bacterium]
MKITGIFAPVPTPFSADGSLDIEAWRINLRIWKESALDGIVICGSNGEMPFVTVEERILLTEVAAEETGGKLKLMAGAHFPSTRETVACAKALASAGAGALLLLPPHYFKGNQTAILNYFIEVADNSPVPIFLYNMPANTGVDMETETIISASQHPNIKGIKDTSGNMTKLGYLAAAAPEDFSVFGGTGNWFLAALAMGACGGTMAASILYPNTCRKIYTSFKENNIKDAMELQAKLLPVSDALTRRFGVPGLKAALDSKGMRGGPCRLPLLPASEEVKKEIMTILDNSGLDKYETWRA